MASLAMIFVMTASLGWPDKRLRLVGFCGLVLLLGSFRFLAAVSPDPVLPETKQSFSGVICEEPDERTDKTLITLCETEVNAKPAGYKVLATVPRVPTFSYGDRIKGTGKIQEPKDAEEPGEFSYKDYLSRYGIAAVVYYPKIEKSGEGQGNRFKRSLLGFKKEFIFRTSEILPEPENSFLSGLLVGAKRGIPENIMDGFNRTGTTHIIAISGFNITIIAWALDKLLNRFGRRISFICSILCIALFVVLTGASASVVRAGIMGSLGLVALNLGRLYVINNAMALTAVVMLWINPKLLLFDVGFQLSFLSLMGLVYLTPRLEPWFSAVPKFIRVFLVATISAQIFTLPVLLYNFDRLSLISPLANILVLPLIPPAMLTGFLTGGLALLSPVLALPAAWMTWFVLSLIIKIVTVLSDLPFASVSIESPAWFIWVYYAVLAFLLAGTIKKIRTIWKRQQSA